MSEGTPVEATDKRRAKYLTLAVLVVWVVMVFTVTVLKFAKVI